MSLSVQNEIFKIFHDFVKLKILNEISFEIYVKFFWISYSNESIFFSNSSFYFETCSKLYQINLTDSELSLGLLKKNYKPCNSTVYK